MFLLNPLKQSVQNQYPPERKATLMRRQLIAVLFTAATSLLAPWPSQAQQATEQFVPLGQSPGVSKVHTVIGTIDAIDSATRTITVAGAAGPSSVRVARQTNIWLDRSKIKQINTVGAFADLAAGQKVEVKFVDSNRRQVADWIKIEQR